MVDTNDPATDTVTALARSFYFALMRAAGRAPENRAALEAAVVADAVQTQPDAANFGSQEAALAPETARTPLGGVRLVSQPRRHQRPWSEQLGGSAVSYPGLHAGPLRAPKRSWAG